MKKLIGLFTLLLILSVLGVARFSYLQTETSAINQPPVIKSQVIEAVEEEPVFEIDYNYIYPENEAYPENPDFPDFDSMSDVEIEEWFFDFYGEEINILDDSYMDNLVYESEQADIAFEQLKQDIDKFEQDVRWGRFE